MSAKTINPGQILDPFEPNPLLLSGHRGALEQQLERLKEQLLAPMLASVRNVALLREMRWVANEATALAWFAFCPVLVLPMLLEEKIQIALQRWERQELLRNGIQV